VFKDRLDERKLHYDVVAEVSCVIIRAQNAAVFTLQSLTDLSVQSVHLLLQMAAQSSYIIITINCRPAHHTITDAAGSSQAARPTGWHRTLR